MEADKDPQTPPPIFDQLKDYAEIRLKIAKYKAIEGGTTIAASLMADLAVLFCALLAFVFASITLAYFLSYVLDSLWEGFGCVALIYLLIAVFIKIYKKKLEKPIINTLIQKIIK